MLDATNQKSCNASNIIVLETDDTIAKRLSMSIWAKTNMRPHVVPTALAGIAYLKEQRRTVFAASVKLNAPEANLLLDELTRNGVPVVAYGEEFNQNTHTQYSTLSISAFIPGKPTSMPHAVGEALSRMVRNRDITILVVDDSRSMSSALTRFLSTRCYKTIKASDGIEALKQLEKHPEIKLVITDNEMPNMDGFTLVKEIRKQYTKDDLAVIGMSAKTNSMLSVRFINNGANDFLHKPFVKEELFCRVDHNVEMLNRIEIIRDLSNKDPLTKLYNRRYFFDNCDVFIADADVDNQSITVSMIDIDQFKQFNDTYGHDVGDDVIMSVAHLIRSEFTNDAIVCRFGGEEFCILAAHSQGEDIFARYDKLRRKIESSPMDVDGKPVTVTVSMGVCTEDGTITDRIKQADSRLYVAKETGRNRVVMA